MLARRWINHAHFTINALFRENPSRRKMEIEKEKKGTLSLRVVIVGITNVNTINMNTQHTELKASEPVNEERRTWHT